MFIYWKNGLLYLLLVYSDLSFTSAQYGEYLLHQPLNLEVNRIKVNVKRQLDRHLWFIFVSLTVTHTHCWKWSIRFQVKTPKFFFVIYLYAVYWVISIFWKCHPWNIKLIHFKEIVEKSAVSGLNSNETVVSRINQAYSVFMRYF